MPLFTKDALELQPYGGTAGVPGVGYEAISIQPLRENALAQGDGCAEIHAVETGAQPVLLRSFDDEGGPIFIEAIGVQVEPAPFGFAEIEREGVELFARPQPDETIGPNLNVGPEYVFVFAPRGRGDAIRGNNEVIVRGVIVRIFDFGFKDEVYAQACGALLQNLEQLDARDPAETMAAGGCLGAFEEDVDVVPVPEGAGNGAMSFRIGLSESVHGFVGEDDAPAEGCIGAIALDHGHIPIGIGLFRQNGKVQAGRTATQANDFHAGRTPPDLMRLPPEVFARGSCRFRLLGPPHANAVALPQHRACHAGAGWQTSRQGSSACREREFLHNL